MGFFKPNIRNRTKVNNKLNYEIGVGADIAFNNQEQKGD